MASQGYPPIVERSKILKNECASKRGGIMAKDPVCNMNVDEAKAAATSIFKGVTYYFCAASCKEKFDKEPEKYLEKDKE